MKITTSRRDDIVKERDAWQSEFDEQTSRYESQENEYNAEYARRGRSIQSAVEQYLSEFKLNLRIDVTSDFSSGYTVIIYCNDKLFDESTALSWDYRISLGDDGTLKAESGSWSGLRATTAEQLSDLKESVRCIEFIQHMDWVSILSVRKPKYSDYVTEERPVNRSKEFANRIRQADIEDKIENGEEIPGIKNSGRIYLGDVNYVVVSQTPKRYKIKEIAYNNDGQRFESVPYVIDKDKFMDKIIL